MTPYTDQGSGTYILDRRFRGVGRIKRASGTTHLPTFRRLNEMLSGLFARGRIDLLRAIRDHTLTPLQVWDAYRVGELERLPRPEAMRPLAETMEAWIEGLQVPDDVSAKHKVSLGTSLKY